MTTPEIPRMTPEEIRRARINAEAANWNLAKLRARQGDPIDYIRLQWPGIILDDWQIRELKEFFRPEVRECYIKGNTGCGKGAFIGICVCLFFDLFPDSVIILTRDSFDTAKKVLFKEVVKWFKGMALKPPHKPPTADKIEDAFNDGHYIRVSNPGSDEGFSGIHAPNVLFVFDEATADVLEDRYGLADTQATKFIATSNPRNIFGNFRMGFPLGAPNVTQTIPGTFGLRRVATIGGKDCMNVRLKRLKVPVGPRGGIEIDGRMFDHGEPIPLPYYEKVKPIIPGQTTYDQYLGILIHPNPDHVNCYAHGMFPDEDPEKQVVSLSWLTEPHAFHARFQKVYEYFKRRHKPRSILDNYFRIEALGLDVAASDDGDESVLTIGGSLGIREQWAMKFSDTTELVEWVLEVMIDHFGIRLEKSGLPIGVDMDGVGKGVGDMLKKRGCRVIEIHGAASPDVGKERYANKRAEAYGEFADRINPAGRWKGQKFAVPAVERLTHELIVHQKIFRKGDSFKFRVTPKEPKPGIKDVISVKQQIGRSPDRSDSAVYFYRALCSGPESNLADWLKSGAMG